MAITVTELTTSSTSAAAASGSTASVSPTGNSILVLFLATGDFGTASVSGFGATWTAAGEHQRGAAAQHGSIWWAPLGGSPGSDTVDFTFDGSAGCHAWDLCEVFGANTSSPIVQFVDSEDTNDTITLAAFANAGNIGMGHIVQNSSSVTIAASGGTDLGATQQVTTPSISTRAQYTAANDNTLAWTVSGTPIPTTGAVEIAIATFVTHTAAATATGTGDLSAVGRQTFMAAFNNAGSGDLTAVARWTANATATLTGTGDLSAVGGLTFNASATLDGTGALVAVAVRQHQAAAALDGQGDLAAAAVRVAVAAALLTGQGDLSATAFTPATLTNRILDPSGTAVPKVRVTVKLNPAGAEPDAGVIGNTSVTTITDSSGDWTAELVGNDRIDFVGSTYIVTQRMPDGTESTWKVELVNGETATVAESLA